MKHLQKIIAIIVIIGLTQISYGGNIWVDKISIIDANTISVMLSDNPNLEVGEVQWEITILNDISIRGSVVSDTSENKIEVMLVDPILPSTKYSLLTISGADGSMDFETPDNVEWYQAVNLNVGAGQDIDSIEILDDRTVIISYTQNVSSNAYQYKLLAENLVTKIEKPDYFLPELVITLEPPLVSNKNYILMFIDMQDTSGNYLEFDVGIYDFATEDIVSPEQINQEMLDSGETNNVELTLDNESDTMTGSEVNNSINDSMLIDEIGADINLDAANQDSLLDIEIDVADVAIMVTETPDTGAQTWVLIIATLFINTIYYLSRRKKAVLA